MSMQRKDVEIGKCYRHQRRTVRIIRDNGMARKRNYGASLGSPEYSNRHCGWTAINEATGREVHIRSAQGLTPTYLGSAPSKAAPVEQMSTQEHLGVLDELLANPSVLRFWGTSKDLVEKTSQVPNNTPILFITQGMDVRDPARPGAKYTRVAYGDWQQAEGSKYRTWRTVKLFRVPDEVLSQKPGLSPAEESAAERCVQEDLGDVPPGVGIPVTQCLACGGPIDYQCKCRTCNRTIEEQQAFIAEGNHEPVEEEPEPEPSQISGHEGERPPYMGKPNPFSITEANAHVAPEPPEEPPYCDRCGAHHGGNCPEEPADRGHDGALA